MTDASAVHVPNVRAESGVTGDDCSKGMVLAGMPSGRDLLEEGDLEVDVGFAEGPA